MRFRLIPRDEGFYPLFNQSAAVVADAAPLLEELLGGLPATGTTVDRVVELERKGDEITRELIARTDKAIITPFDREDIHALASQLDDVMDDMRAAADLVQMHQVEAPLPEVKELATTITRAAEVNLRLIGKLSRLRDLKEDVDRVYDLESEGDALFRRTMAHLFSGEFPALTVLKWKDVVEELERTLNGLENVAHLVEAIALKHS
jgi:uncharacterized protein